MTVKKVGKSIGTGFWPPHSKILLFEIDGGFGGGHAA